MLRRARVLGRLQRGCRGRSLGGESRRVGIRLLLLRGLE